MRTVKQVAEIVGVSADTIRYYDKRGLLLGVARDRAGGRVFDAQSVEWLRVVVALRESGMTVSEIEQFAKSTVEGDTAAQTRKTLLIERKRALSMKVEALMRHIDTIDRLVDSCDIGAV